MYKPKPIKRAVSNYLFYSALSFLPFLCWVKTAGIVSRIQNVKFLAISIFAFMFTVAIAGALNREEKKEKRKSKNMIAIFIVIPSLIGALIGIFYGSYFVK